MDNLTHTLTGLMLSRVGLNAWCSRATPVLLLAANAPDIDVLSVFTGGTAEYLHYHRGFTHSFVMAPAMAALAVLAAGLAVRGRKMQWFRAFLVALAGVLSHLLMDWTNIYGVRMLWPFSTQWLRLDITPVIDPWIWAVLLLAFLWPILARLVSSEIGAKTRAGRGIAIFALLFICSFEFVRWVLHARAVETMEARMHEGQPPRRVAAFPSFFNPLAWRGLVEIDRGYVIHALNLSREFDPSAGRLLYQPEPSPYLDAARATRPFQVFSDFAPYPLWQVLPLPDPEGAVRVNGVDLRFAMPGEGRFEASAIIEGGRVIRSWFQFTPQGEIPEPK